MSLQLSGMFMRYVKRRDTDENVRFKFDFLKSETDTGRICFYTHYHKSWKLFYSPHTLLRKSQ